MNKTSHSSFFNNISYLNTKIKTNIFSISPISSRIHKSKKSLNYQFQKSLTVSKLKKFVNVNSSPNINNESNNNKIKENLFENDEKEKTKLRRMLSDLNSWNNSINTDYQNKNSFDIKNIKIPQINKNKIISQELIPYIKFRETAKNESGDILLKNEKKLESIKYKFAVFDKDFNKLKFEEESKIKLNDIENANKIVESIKDKKLKKIKFLNEIKKRDSLIIIYKKLAMNKLKKKKFFQLLNETYNLLEKAKIDTNITNDLLYDRIKSIQKYYAVFIDLFKGTSIKVLEDNLRILEQLSLDNNKKEKEKEETNESEEESEKKSKIKNEIDNPPRLFRRKNRFKIKEKIKMYLEYVSIYEDIQNEIHNNEMKFEKMREELDIIVIDIKNKLEEINEDSNNLKLIQKKLSQKQIKYYLKILKKGNDTRFNGLSWIIIRLIELNVPIESSIFPDYLNNDQINYLFDISKYGYEINQLKIILDGLREKETGKANSNLNIFSKINKGLSNFINNSEDNKSDINSYYNNNNKTNQILLKMMQKNPLSLKKIKILKEEQHKFEIEKNMIDLKSKELKRRISMFALDKNFILNNNEKSNKENINNLIILSRDKKSKYFYDILKIIEKINNLNNLLNERKEKELKSFCEKFKYKNLKDEAAKDEFNKVFNALFGNISLQYGQN